MFWSGLHIVVSKSSNFQASGYVSVELTRGVLKSSNFLASGCVWVGLTRGGVKKLQFSGIGLCLGRAYTWRC